MLNDLNSASVIIQSINKLIKKIINCDETYPTCHHPRFHRNHFLDNTRGQLRKDGTRDIIVNLTPYQELSKIKEEGEYSILTEGVVCNGCVFLGDNTRSVFLVVQGSYFFP